MQETHSIVVVDDVPEIREILGFLLEESGWFEIVGEAGSGEEAIRVVEAQRPDLVLLDLDLPDVSGWEVLPALRERAPASAVVILSGNLDDLDPVDESVRGMAAAVLEKGMSNRHLITRLLEVVGQGQRGSDGERPLMGDGLAVRPGAAIDDASAWLNAVMNASTDAVIGSLLDGTVVSWNAAAERLYGYATNEIVGRSVSVLVPPDRPDEVSKVLDAIAGGECVDSYETVRVHKNGTRIDVTVSISPVLTAAGEVIGSVAIVRDISSRRHTDAALTRAIAQLERRNRELLRSNEELDSFAAVASHDLAQPLQVAYGFLDMLNTDYADQLPDRGRQWLTSSLSSLERMRNLVRDILRYARTGAGEPRLVSIPLADVIDVAVSSVAAAIDERSASVEVEVPDGLLVRGDPGQLALVFQNLVANAVKFVPPGRTPEVRVVTEVREHELTVRVSDNGVGIPADQRSKVFEMFQRSTTSAEGGYAGTGLGLAIVKKIVARHGGTVWADEAPGGGTVIAVRLPVATGSGIRD